MSGAVTKRHKQPGGFAPGIYFNLPEERYHGDAALSHSGITDILVSEMDYWENSPLNPHRKFKESDAMLFGKQCHMHLLEPKRFKASFNITGGEYKQHRKTITSNDYRLIKESTAILKADPETAALFLDGYPEVSIFWIDPRTGIRLRIRIDWLRTFGCVDLKRLRSIQKKKLGYDIAQYGYDIQDHLYREGVAMAKAGLRTGKMKAYDATKPDSLVELQHPWLVSFMNDPDNLFRFLVQRSTPPFIYCIWKFDDHIKAEAEHLTNKGILKYKRAIEQYGATGWPYGSGKVETFTIDDMPRRLLDD